MSQALNQLLTLMTLEQVADGLFRGRSEDWGLPQVYGGQVMGQALYAARQTVAIQRRLHSYHCYFLRPGDSAIPIFYRVDILRDGNSFSARQVSALQQDQVIFTLTCSFQQAEEGFEHHAAMPQVPGPEGLPTESEMTGRLAQSLPPLLREKLTGEQPFDIRPVMFHNPVDGQIAQPERHIWLRANGAMPDSDDSHRYLLSYIADFNFLPTALQPHGVGFLDPAIIIATISHATWFHRPVRLDDWLLYAIESPSASGARGFVRGQFFSRDGVLVASTAQEGVIRRRTGQNKPGR